MARAIYIEHSSCSGDTHEYPIATFSDDSKNIEDLLNQLKVDNKDPRASFYIDDYDMPIHNPTSLKDIIRKNKGPMEHQEAWKQNYLIEYFGLSDDGDGRAF